MSAPIPIVLFAFARPDHMQRTLDCLRENKVPRIIAFCDGARNDADLPRVQAVRERLRKIDWCEMEIHERPRNLGLGRNVLTGVTAVAEKHPAFIVVEDDLVFVPGTYRWLCAALEHYRDDERVMSVTGWTHPRITPPDLNGKPYLDRRAECWVWGGYARSWRGMVDETARQKLEVARRKGLDPGAYGYDLPGMASRELSQNIWAVRWLYHHLEHGGLCVRPPWSMVEHIGFDSTATNAASATAWANPPLRDAPEPGNWPEAVEHPACRQLWQDANPRANPLVERFQSALSAAHRASKTARHRLRQVVPEGIRRKIRSRLGWKWFRGDYPSWEQARAASAGYDHAAILDRVLASTLEVKAGRAAFERDSVLFATPEADAPLLAQLNGLLAGNGGTLRVLDFGGSLGSTYWRHRTFFPKDANVRWDVVEQTNYVEAGKRSLADAPVAFFSTIAAATAQHRYDLLLASTVLQYLEDPFDALAEFGASGIPHVLLNNLPLIEGSRDRLRVQHVPPHIYQATYPVWFFSRAEFTRRVESRFQIVSEFASEAQWPVDGTMLQSTGMLLRPKS